MRVSPRAEESRAGQEGLTATRIAVPGRTAPRSGDQPPQACSLRAGHSGSTRSTSTRPAATTWRTRSPSVRWCSTYVHDAGLALDVRGAVEVRRRRGEPVRPRVVGERPPHRVRRREHEPPARPQHAGGLREHRTAVGDERHDAVGGEHPVDARVGQGQREPVALQRGWSPLGRSIRRAVRSIPIDRSLATTRTSWCARQPARALGGAGADLEHRHPVAHPEQVELGLGPALRPPDELAVAEEGAVLGVVVVGLAVPPGPVRRAGLVPADRPPARVVDHPVSVLVVTAAPADRRTASGPFCPRRARTSRLSQHPCGRCAVTRALVPSHRFHLSTSEFLLHDCQHGRHDRPSDRHQRHRL